MYKLGEEKGSILEQQLDMLPRKPKIAVELGCFLGYSALRTARHLAGGGQMYCFEYNPMHAEVAKKVVEYGGLGDRVTFVVGVSTQKLPTMASKCKGADFVLLDHAKVSFWHLQQPDTCQAQQGGRLCGPRPCNRLLGRLFETIWSFNFKCLMFLFGNSGFCDWIWAH
jgi:hypothetical protein